MERRRRGPFRSNPGDGWRLKPGPKAEGEQMELGEILTVDRT